ncbi:MAG: hypothetical protein US97_C0056G0002 [Microgenomates group bacterium GW2011_GWF1_38_5]|nr:MAG: hypothetical protein US97_C0056G0002 [Microgenomates group bacterium GW2011_GWF1_38_5]
MKNYKEQYQHPQWQKKRLEILQRDNFTCRSCDSQEKQLSVHHQYYLEDKMIWEYPNNCYLSLCEDCHEEANNLRKTTPHNLFVLFCDLGFTVWELNYMAAILGGQKEEEAIQGIKTVIDLQLRKLKAENHE